MCIFCGIYNMFYVTLHSRKHITITGGFKHTRTISLTRRDRNKMIEILQTKFSNWFSCMEFAASWLKHSISKLYWLYNDEKFNSDCVFTKFRVAFCSTYVILVFNLIMVLQRPAVSNKTCSCQYELTKWPLMGSKLHETNVNCKVHPVDRYEYFFFLRT